MGVFSITRTFGKEENASVIPVLWDGTTVYFGATNASQVDRFSLLFQQTFGVELTAVTSGTAADDDSGPSSFVPGAADGVAWVRDGASRDYPDYYPLDFVDRRMLKPISTDALLKEYAGGNLDFDPGSRYSYSNTGYILLGGAVEKVSDEPFGTFVETRLLKPLKLDRSRFGSPACRPRPGTPRSGWATRNRPSPRRAGGSTRPAGCGRRPRTCCGGIWR